MHSQYQLLSVREIRDVTMSAVITAVMIGAGLLALAIWIEIRERPTAPGDG
jgi:hypothetical protein